MTLFLDLDGTIVDQAARHHRAHVDALHDPRSALHRARYWDLKRAQTPERDILGMHCPGEPYEPYETRRRELLEDPAYLALDTVFPGVADTMALLAEQALVLVTLRRSEPSLHAQLRGLDLSRWFERIVCGAAGAEPWRTKRDLIVPWASAGDWMVGDTEADVLAGRSLGLTTCAVTTGIRNADRLAAHGPDHLIDRLAQLPARLRTMAP